MSEQTTTTELATLQSRADRIQEVADATSIAKLHSMPQVTRALTLARGIGELRRLFEGEVLDTFMSLMDSSIGFRTDRPKGTFKDGKPVAQYGRDTVRDVMIEALLRGANPVGNEVNILVGRLYLTKEYYERLVRDLVSDLRVTEGVPTMSGGGALVSMRASWIFNGRHDSLDCIKTDAEDNRIPVRVNAGMGADAVIGKAYRKLYAKIHRRVTGSTWLEEETDSQSNVIDAVATPVEPESKPVEPAEAATETPTEATAEEHAVFTGIEQHLSGLANIGDVNAFEKTSMGILETDEDKVKLTEWCDWRREQIRESRGPRSNKQKEDSAA